jgi:hypothetical protein
VDQWWEPPAQLSALAEVWWQTGKHVAWFSVQLLQPRVIGSEVSRRAEVTWLLMVSHLKISDNRLAPGSAPMLCPRNGLTVLIVWRLVILK